MRVNIYSQELANEWELVKQKSNTGVTYHAVRMLLHSSPLLHHPPQDDDRSAVTIWLPKSRERRQRLADTLRSMATAVLNAPAETGLD
jgi:hypothetical protein